MAHILTEAGFFCHCEF